MLDIETIIFIKKYLTTLNYIVGIISFLIGVSPLMMEREKVEKQANVIYIEISAAIFLLFTISMVSLDYISDIDLLKVGSCVSLKEKYVKELDFKELHLSNKFLKIKKLGEDSYLVQNKNGYFSKIKRKNDYKYNNVKCY